MFDWIKNYFMIKPEDPAVPYRSDSVSLLVFVA